MFDNFSTGNLSSYNDSDIDCNLFPESPDHCVTLVYTKRVFNSIAMLGCIITITIIVFFKKYSEFSQRLIAQLSIASFLLAFAGLLTDINTEPTKLCVVQGAIIMYAVVAICLWIMVVLVNIYKLAVFGNSLKSWERVLTLLCWLVPFVFMGVPFIGKDVYGPAGAWCWFVNKWEWIFGVWYIWRILSIILIIILAVRIIFELRKASRIGRTDSANINALKDDIRTLRIYPVAYFILNIIQIIDRTYQSVRGKHDTQYAFPLTLLHTIIGFSYGTVLCLIFVMDKKTITLLKPGNIKKTFNQKWRTKEPIREYNIGESFQQQEANANRAFES